MAHINTAPSYSAYLTAKAVWQAAAPGSADKFNKRLAMKDLHRKCMEELGREPADRSA